MIYKEGLERLFTHYMSFASWDSLREPCLRQPAWAVKKICNRAQWVGGGRASCVTPVEIIQVMIVMA